MTAPKPDGQNHDRWYSDWFGVVCVYLNDAQALLFAKSLNYLSRQRSNPNVLSAIINSLGLLTLVLHGMAHHVTSLAEATTRGHAQTRDLISKLDQVAQLLHEIRTSLTELTLTLNRLTEKITKAKIPWGKAVLIAVVSSFISTGILINADHLQFLRIPDAEDVEMRDLLDAKERFRKATIKLENENVALKFELNNRKEVDQTALTQAYNAGYSKAASDIQKKFEGQ